jgi:hypothetical protein
VQKPTQALQSVKGQDNTFDWHPKWTRTLPSLIYFSYDINRDPHSKKISNIKFDIWHPAVGLRCRNPPRHFSHLDARPISLIETPSGQVLCCPQYIVHWIFMETPLHKQNFKYQSWYLTACCGLEVQKPTQVLQLVKGLALIYFSWFIHRDARPQKKIKISKLIFDTLLWAWGAGTHPCTSVS